MHTTCGKKTLCVLLHSTNPLHSQHIRLRIDFISKQYGIDGNTWYSFITQNKNSPCSPSTTLTIREWKSFRQRRTSEGKRSDVCICRVCKQNTIYTKFTLEICLCKLSRCSLYSMLVELSFIKCDCYSVGFASS